MASDCSRGRMALGGWISIDVRPASLVVCWGSPLQRWRWTGSTILMFVLYVRRCWQDRDVGRSTRTPPECTVLVKIRLVLIGRRRGSRWGMLWTCALWNTTSAPTSRRCSREWMQGVGNLSCTSRRALCWILSSLLRIGCVQDNQASVLYSRWGLICALYSVRIPLVWGLRVISVQFLAKAPNLVQMLSIPY